MKTIASLKRAILLIGLVGFMLFGGAFMLSYIRPQLVESALQQVVLIEVEREASARVDAALDSRLAELARRALGKTEEQLEQSRKSLDEMIAREAAEVVASMARADCECRLRLATAVRVFEQQRFASIAQVRERLSELTKSVYATVTANLLREFRIFTGTNAIAFALLGCTAAIRGRAAPQLLLPAAAVLGATFVTGGLYLFGQDWLHAILFYDYIGLGYAAYLAVVALLICDVLANRARMTTRAVNTLLAAAGAAFSMVPC